jgi:predicted Zn-dependent protease
MHSVRDLRLAGRIIGGLVLATVVLAPVAGSTKEPDGVKVGGASIFRHLVSAERIEKAGEQQYASLTRQAYEKRALAPDSHPQVQRLRRIHQDLLPFSYRFNPRARDWKWEVNVIGSRQVNAFCMPGGKIAFFLGILERLQLSDDEAALVMGHEIAHALREHARERAGKQLATNVGALAVSIFVGGGAGDLARISGGLLGLKFSRDDETEADLIGMEMAARAGYDPRAGITLWEKMSQAAKGGPPEWLSTHPAGTTRIDTIKANLKDVMPLYEEALAKRRR